MSPRTDVLAAADPEIAAIVGREVERQNTTIQLIASENFTSPAVMAAQGTVLTNKYSEGYPGKRYYGGNVVVDEAEELARSRACELFGAEHANVQPHSARTRTWPCSSASSNARRPRHGDAPRSGWPPHPRLAGQLQRPDLRLRRVRRRRRDRDARLRRDPQARGRVAPEGDHRRRHGVSRTIDFAAFRSIADEIGALLIVDAAHIAGLIAGGAHPSPVPHADVVTLTTHKTLRGPRAGCILSRAEYAARSTRRCSRAAGRPVDARDRGEGGGVQARVGTRFCNLRRADRGQRRGPGRGPRVGRVPHRLRRHRQPPDAGGPAPVRCDRQGRPGGARPGRDHLQQERDPERSREAVRHERAAARDGLGDDGRDGRAGDGRDRPADRRRAARTGRRCGARRCAGSGQPAVFEVRSLSRARRRRDRAANDHGQGARSAGQ